MRPIDHGDLTPEQREALVEGFDRLLDPEAWQVVPE
jgi:hypothetical protein